MRDVLRAAAIFCSIFLGIWFVNKAITGWAVSGGITGEGFVYIVAALLFFENARSTVAASREKKAGVKTEAVITTGVTNDGRVILFFREDKEVTTIKLAPQRARILSALLEIRANEAEEVARTCSVRRVK